MERKRPFQVRLTRALRDYLNVERTDDQTLADVLEQEVWAAYQSRLDKKEDARKIEDLRKRIEEYRRNLTVDKEAYDKLNKGRELEVMELNRAKRQAILMANEWRIRFWGVSLVAAALLIGFFFLLLKLGAA